MIIDIDAGGAWLQGDLVEPASAHGVVVFAHGSGSDRFSPRNRYLAETLNRRGLSTLLIDLLTADEERVDARTTGYRFDVALLAERVLAACEAVHERKQPIGLFGDSTGAAAALVAAARRPGEIGAVVARGGRPDLAGHALEEVRAPTLLIVGSLDYQVLEVNENALARLEHVASRLEIVDGATHLFEEPGRLHDVAELAGDWFDRYLPRFRVGGPLSGLRSGRARP